MLDLETFYFFLSSRLLSAESYNRPDAVIPHQQGQTICDDRSNISGTGDLGQLWSPIVAGPEILFANLGSLISAERSVSQVVLYECFGEAWYVILIPWTFVYLGSFRHESSSQTGSGAAREYRHKLYGSFIVTIRGLVYSQIMVKAIGVA